MTTLENRPNTALLVVDVQNGVVDGAHERDAVIANIGSLVDRARRERVPVVWVQHSDEDLATGTDDSRIVPELAPSDTESVIEKNYGDSFENTTLETVLSELGVGRLVIVGAQTDACIRSTLHGALVRGYDASLVSDAHTTEDQTAWGAPPPDQVVAHTNSTGAIRPRPGERREPSGPRMSISAPRPEPMPAGGIGLAPHRDTRWRRRGPSAPPHAGTGGPGITRACVTELWERAGTNSAGAQDQPATPVVEHDRAEAVHRIGAE